MTKSGSFDEQKRQFRSSKAPISMIETVGFAQPTFRLLSRHCKKGIDMWVVLPQSFGLFEGCFLTEKGGRSVKKNQNLSHDGLRDFLCECLKEFLCQAVSSAPADSTQEGRTLRHSDSSPLLHLLFQPRLGQK